MAPRRLRRVLAVAALAVAALGVAVVPSLGVVGGSVIQIQAAPWTVFVQQTAGISRYLCTGSVVDASHIVTAAHCVFDDAGHMAQPSQLSVRAGVSNFSSPASTDAEQDRSVTAVRVHPGYSWSETPGPDDVAVLVLSSPLDLTGSAVQAVALPASALSYPAGTAVGLAGFGKVSPTTSSSGPLDWMTATVDAQGACGDPEAGFIPNDGIILCASSPTSSVCNGDSGSGLVTTGGTPILIGVVSASTSCDAGSEGFYTYLAAPEILQFVEGNDSPPAAPRSAASTFVRIAWYPPLVAGNTLQCTSGDWPAPTPQLSYIFVNSTTGQVLQSGKSASYLIPASAVGTAVSCEVAATSAGGTTLEETEQTSVVHAAPQAALRPVAPLETAPGARLPLIVTLHLPAGLWGKVQVCVTLPADDGGRLCHSTTNRNGAPGTFPFQFAFRVRPRAPRGYGRIAIAAVAGVSSVSGTARLHVS